MEKSKRVVGYARVSTEAQDITRQIELITAYCSDPLYELLCGPLNYAATMRRP